MSTGMMAMLLWDMLKVSRYPAEEFLSPCSAWDAADAMQSTWLAQSTFLQSYLSLPLSLA